MSDSNSHSQQNILYYGDCLDILREHVADESVDLVYLDPPFNSNRNYNTFFAERSEEDADAQITAFEDTWHWCAQTQTEFDTLFKNSAAIGVASLLSSLHDVLGNSDLMAYLVMMSTRLVEMHRILKSTGTLFLHCDPTAASYLKLILDAIFGVLNFRNEIIWKRSTAKSHASKNMPCAHDIIYRYTKSDNFTFHSLYTEYDEEYVKLAYSHKDPDGRQYTLGDLVNPNKNRPNLTYEFLGVTRVWRWTKDRMQKAYEDGLIVQAKPGTVPRFKRYLDEMKGVPLTDVWMDIAPLQGQSAEYLGYPTQKPIALLERILQIASDEGDVVLDPFCGCGTAVHAATRLRRRWIGVDITHLAIAMITRRLHAAFPSIDFETRGIPKDVASARFLVDGKGLEGQYQFQWWALSMINAMPYQGKKKGADGGIDGVIYAYDAPNAKKPFRIVVSVKSGAIPANHIRELIGLVSSEKENTQMAILLTLRHPSKKMLKDAMPQGFTSILQAGNISAFKSTPLKIFSLASVQNITTSTKARRCTRRPRLKQTPNTRSTPFLLK